MKKLTFVLVIVALLLAACGAPVPAPTEIPPTEVPPTEVPPTEVPPEPTAPPEVELPEGCTEDLTGETITFYHFGDLTGVYAFITQPLLAGFTDSIAYYNDQGGICGATIVSEYADDAGELEEAQAIYDRFSAVDPKPWMILLYGSGETEMLRSQVAEDEIAVFTAGQSTPGLYSESGQEPGWVFGVTPLYTDQFGAFCDWVAATWEGEEPPKIGHLSFMGAFGQATETPETTAYCESVGVEIVGGEYFMPGTPDLTVQIQSLMAEGANIIYTTSLATGTAQVLKDAAALGVADEVMIAGVNWALDLATVGLAGAAANNFIGHLPYTWWDETDHPGIQLMTQEWIANEREISTRNVAYLLAWGIIDTYGELVKIAVADVGYENVDGAAIYAAFQKLDYEALDGAFHWTFDSETRAPSMTRIGQVQFTAEGAPYFAPLSDWLECPDLRPGGADVP